MNRTALPTPTHATARPFRLFSRHGANLVAALAVQLSVAAALLLF